MNADNTHVTPTYTNVEVLVLKAQEELTHVSEYMRVNRRCVNPQTAKYMRVWHLLRTDKVDIHEILRINGSNLKRVEKLNALE